MRAGTSSLRVPPPARTPRLRSTDCGTRWWYALSLTVAQLLCRDLNRRFTLERHWHVAFTVGLASLIIRSQGLFLPGQQHPRDGSCPVDTFGGPSWFWSRSVFGACGETATACGFSPSSSSWPVPSTACGSDGLASRRFIRRGDRGCRRRGIAVTVCSRCTPRSGSRSSAWRPQPGRAPYRRGPGVDTGLVAASLGSAWWCPGALMSTS
jgi:hypothetical protein